MSARAELLSRGHDTAPATEPADLDAPGTLPRVLAGVRARGALALAEHTVIHGPLPALPASRRRDRASWLIDQLERADLRGRGGGGFSTAAKLRAVAGARGRPVVVVNASESEPASHKDRTLIQAMPHLVLDGAQLAAEALGASELIVAVCESLPASWRAVTAACAERSPSRPRLSIRVAAVPNTYVAGNESALVNHLNGGPAIPTLMPPRPSERGVARRPTLVCNAETLAQIALLARHGTRWFRQVGTASQPGSALVTLLGPVARPGVYEIEYGAPLAALLDAAGGLASAPRALLIGGYGGSWIDGELLERVELCDERLAQFGARLGAGVLLLLSREACPVAEVARTARWLAAQSAGQCGPCVHGLAAIASGLEELTSGRAQGATCDRVARLTSVVARRGACGHPDGAARFVSSALETFAAEFADHAEHGPCEACARAPELPLPARPTLPSAKPIVVR